MLNFQVYYYNVTKKWRQWAHYKNESICELLKTYAYKPGELVIYANLNTHGAWEAFLHCNDKKVLAQSLPWIDKAIALEKADAGLQPAYLDTKAALLYKLGDRKSAIALEKQAITILRATDKKRNIKNDDSVQGFLKLIQQMKAGEPTYLADGAVWTNTTLPKHRE